MSCTDENNDSDIEFLKNQVSNSARTAGAELTAAGSIPNLGFRAANALSSVNGLADTLTKYMDAAINNHILGTLRSPNS